MESGSIRDVYDFVNHYNCKYQRYFVVVEVVVTPKGDIAYGFATRSLVHEANTEYRPLEMPIDSKRRLQEKGVPMPTRPSDYADIEYVPFDERALFVVDSICDVPQVTPGLKYCKYWDTNHPVQAFREGHQIVDAIGFINDFCVVVESVPGVRYDVVGREQAFRHVGRPEIRYPSV